MIVEFQEWADNLKDFNTVFMDILIHVKLKALIYVSFKSKIWDCD